MTAEVARGAAPYVFAAAIPPLLLAVLTAPRFTAPALRA